MEEVYHCIKCGTTMSKDNSIGFVNIDISTCTDKKYWNKSQSVYMCSKCFKKSKKHFGLNKPINIDKTYLDEYGNEWYDAELVVPSYLNEDWVMVLPYDGDNECIPTIAELRNDYLWHELVYDSDDHIIDGQNSPFKIKYWRPIN